MKNRFRAKRIPDVYLPHTGWRRTGYTNSSTYWSQLTQFTHAQKDESSTITTMYLWNRRLNSRTHTAKMTSIPTSQRKDMVIRNIITPEAVWEELEDSWLYSAGWFIRVIKRTRRRNLVSAMLIKPGVKQSSTPIRTSKSKIYRKILVLNNIH